MSLHRNYLNQILVQDIDVYELSKQDAILDSKYQNITYYMHSKEKTINEKPIDFLSATSEMLLLDWNYSPNYIGFTNNDTKENVQFSCVGIDKWYVEILINKNSKWTGYVLCCYSDFEPIERMLQLFFEELSWTETLPWKLKRIGKYAND